MIALALVLAPLPARLDRIDARLDCDVHHYRSTATGERRDDGQYSNRIFLLLPTKAKKGSGEYLSVVTMDDGRSWFWPGQVDRREGKNWPDLNVSIDGGTGAFTSDKARDGVILFQQKSRIYDSTENSMMEAECRLIPKSTDRSGK